MARGLAELALRRPWALLAANLAVLAGTTVLAVGASDRLGIGSLALDEGGHPSRNGARADLVIATTGDLPVDSGPYAVALRVISAQVRADADVVALRRARCPRTGARPRSSSPSAVTTRRTKRRSSESSPASIRAP